MAQNEVVQVKLSIIAPDTTDACAIYRAHPWDKLGVETEFYSGKLGFQLWQAVISADVVLLKGHGRHSILASRRLSKTQVRNSF